MLRSKRGHTLVEISTAVVVISLISAFGINSFRTTKEKSELQSQKAFVKQFKARYERQIARKGELPPNPSNQDPDNYFWYEEMDMKSEMIEEVKSVSCRPNTNNRQTGYQCALGFNNGMVFIVSDSADIVCTGSSKHFKLTRDCKIEKK